MIIIIIVQLAKFAEPLSATASTADTDGAITRAIRVSNLYLSPTSYHIENAKCNRLTNLLQDDA